MEITITITLEPEDRDHRDDPERVAECLYWQLVEGNVAAAGNHGEARYRPTGYTLVTGEPERDADGYDLDVLPEPQGAPAV